MSLRRAFCSSRFPVAVFLTTLLLILDLLPVFLSGITIKDGGMYSAYDLLELYELRGMTMFLGFSFITVVLPYAGVFCEDVQNGFLIPFVKRSSAGAYAAGSVLACGVSSFLCAFLGEVLCLGFYALFCPLIGENFQTGNFPYSLVQGGHYVAFLTAKAVLFGLRGVFFGIVVVFISTMVRNRYVVYAAPFILYYFLMKFAYSIFNVPSTLNIGGIYFVFAFGSEYELKSLAYAALVTILVGVAAATALSRKTRRMI